MNQDGEQGKKSVNGEDSNSHLLYAIWAGERIRIEFWTLYYIYRVGFLSVNYWNIAGRKEARMV